MNQPLVLRRLPGHFAVCRLEPTVPLPGWALHGEFFSVTRTADELSILCAQESVPADVRCQAEYVGLRVDGVLDFSLTGVLADLSAALADAKISLLAIATYDTDYLFVQAAVLEQAIAALTAHGHTVYG
jgi:uncharacterized protein